MAIKVAINGFGRIGRLVLRAFADRDLLGKEIDVVAITTRDCDAAYEAYKLNYDSAQGRFKYKISSKKSSADKPHDDVLVVHGKNGEDAIQLITRADHPSKLPWKELAVDYVIESSGKFNNLDDAKGHLEAGAKKVILTAPGKGGVKTFVMGVNHENYVPEEDHVISNASCTTNCLAPVVHVLIKEGIGIEKGLMTTIHAYTSSQFAVDSTSTKNWRIGRAAATNIIPTTTGAAKAVAEVIPEVKGIMTGMAFRVPTITGSAVDLTVTTKRDTSIEEIDSLMKKASESYLKGVLEYTKDPIVSTDVIGNDASSIYDSEASLKNNLPGEKRFFKLVSWYDNEWGYSMRTVDMLLYVAEKDGKL